MDLEPCREDCGKMHFGGQHKASPAALKHARYHAGGACRWCGQPLGNRQVTYDNIVRGYHDPCWDRKMAFKGLDEARV